MVFYGVHDPAAARDEQPGKLSPTVFEEMRDALSMMKNRKEARMRAFNARFDAEEYSRFGYSKPTQPANPAPKLQQQEPDVAVAAPITSTTNVTSPLHDSGAGPTTNGNGSSSTATTEQPASVVFVVPAPPKSVVVIGENGTAKAATNGGGDKPAYRGPKSQELVQFRKLIEQSKYEQVRDTVWRNPRYLIGSGDTPALLKESCRYNALHVAALAKNATMCELLLDIIGDPQFIQLLYGKKNAHHCAETSSILQDLYLNMPERGRNETPLHLAAKFGALEVVDVLTSYAQCSSRPNVEGQLPIDIVCSRVERDPSFVKQIKELLNGRFYVPVIRSVDNTMPPMIGEPFSPKNPPKLQFDPLSPEMEIQAYAGPMNRDEAHTFRRRWKTPPRSANSSTCPTTPQQSPQPSSPFARCSPRATPPPSLRFTPAKMSTPDSRQHHITSRQLFAGNSPANRTPASANGSNGHRKQVTSLTDDDDDVTDDDAANDDDDEHSPGGGKLADSSLTGDDPTQSSPPTGTSAEFGTYRNHHPLLDDSLMNASTGSVASGCDSPMFRERHAKLCDTEKGLEVIGRELAAQRSVKWREYWPFLDTFVDIRSADGLAAFEERLAAAEASRRPAAVIAAVPEAGLANPAEVAVAAVATHSPMSMMSTAAASLKETGISLLCKALNQLEVKSAFSADGNLPHAPPASAPSAQSTPLPPPVLAHQPSATMAGGQHRRSIVHQTHPPHGAFSAYLCAEKSWQVYAKRVTDALRGGQTQPGANAASTTMRDQLLGELRRLRSLVCSYREDERFAGVDFGQAHSRFAHLIVGGLVQSFGADAAAAASQQNGGGGGGGVDATDLARLHGEFQHTHDTVAATCVAGGNSADEDLQCVLANALHYMAADGRRVRQPWATGLTEDGARAMWSAEERCRCEWTAGVEETTQTAGGRPRQQQQRHLKRTAQRMDQQQLQHQQMEHDGQQQQQQQMTAGLSNGWQSRSLSAQQDSDEDDYMSDSDSDSDDDVYLTPPESMSPASPASGLSSDAPAYSNFAMGEEPTKADVDVLNALGDLHVDVATYPHIVHWRDAMNRFSMVERNSFPSGTPAASAAPGQNRCRTNAKVSATLPVKCLFRSSFKPITLPPPPPPNNISTITTTTTNTAAAPSPSQSSSHASAGSSFGTAAAAAVASLHSTLSTLTITAASTQQQPPPNTHTTTSTTTTTTTNKPPTKTASADTIAMPPPPSPSAAASSSPSVVVVRPPAKSSALGFLPKLGAKLQQLNRDILRPASFVPSADANARNTEQSNANDLSDMIVAISPKFAMTPKRKPPKELAASVATVSSQHQHHQQQQQQNVAAAATVVAWPKKTNMNLVQ